MTKVKYYTTDEAAELCGVHRQTIYNWIKKGVIETEQLGSHYRLKIAETEIPAYLRKDLQNEKTN